MLKFIIQSLFISVVSVSGGAAQATGLDQRILDLPITLISGKTVTLGQYKGQKPVYLKFWASYCVECIQQMPHLQHTYEKYRDKVEVIAVNIGVNDDAAMVAATQKKFGLTMPVAIDQSGELARAFNLIATPYHVLINQQGQVAHAEYVHTEETDRHIALLAQGQSVVAKNLKPDVQRNVTADLSGIQEKPTALFFLATWCDWYLKDSRPEISRSCIAAQRQVNALYQQYPQIHWVGIATRLWTEDKDLVEYKHKFHVQHPVFIDSTNDITFKYHVKHYPTLILLKQGKEVFRTHEMNEDELSTNLLQLTK